MKYLLDSDNEMEKLVEDEKLIDGVEDALESLHSTLEEIRPYTGDTVVECKAGDIIFMNGTIIQESCRDLLKAKGVTVIYVDGYVDKVLRFPEAD